MYDNTSEDNAVHKVFLRALWPSEWWEEGGPHHNWAIATLKMIRTSWPKCQKTLALSKMSSLGLIRSKWSPGCLLPHFPSGPFQNIGWHWIWIEIHVQWPTPRDLPLHSLHTSSNNWNSPYCTCEKN